VVVITLAAARIASFTGGGSSVRRRCQRLGGVRASSSLHLRHDGA
jgi:hypothetical protein